MKLIQLIYLLKISKQFGYDNLLSNSINLGNVINLEDIEKVNIDKLIKSLMI